MQAAGKRTEVAESEGEGVLELGEVMLGEIGKRVGEVVEEDSLHGVEGEECAIEEVER